MEARNATHWLKRETNRYKIGDAFFHIPLPQAQELLGISTAKLEEEIEALEDKLGSIRGEMTQLKVELYARFGKTINLET
jgi:prefoldin subunit 4